MDSHAQEYFSPYSNENPHGHFHQVINLTENQSFTWNSVQKMSSGLSKGWFELSRLSMRDRIDFIHDFWLTKMPYHPLLKPSLEKFFDSVDDIGIFLTQRTNEDLFEPHMVYSLRDDSGYYHGEPSASEQEIITLQKEFEDYILPRDYLSFLQIHNGFAKLTDTGILKSSIIKENFLEFEALLEQSDPIIKADGSGVNPNP